MTHEPHILYKPDAIVIVIVMIIMRQLMHTHLKPNVGESLSIQLHHMLGNANSSL